MKIMKIGLRIWIGIVSIFSFLFGWILFAHSAKPVSILSQPGQPSQPQPVTASQLQPIPTVPPINDPQSGFQNFQPIQQQPQMLFQPRLRSGGS
jgi:hypothetical protein